MQYTVKSIYVNICLIVFLSKWFKVRDALSPQLLNFALEYAIRNVQENQVGLKMNGTHRLLSYVDDVSLLGDNIDTINEKRNFDWYY
jgi:hypothetical protein